MAVGKLRTEVDGVHGPTPKRLRVLPLDAFGNLGNLCLDLRHGGAGHHAGDGDGPPVVS